MTTETTIQTTNATQYIDQFREAMEAFTNGLVKACAVYAEAVDAGAKADVQAAFPQISTYMWSNFERVGRGQLPPELVTRPRSLVEAVVRLPESDRAAVVREPVTVVEDAGDPKSVRLVKVDMLDSGQIRQVFDYDHLRTAEEQCTYMQRQEANKTASAKAKAATGRELPPPVFVGADNCLHIRPNTGALKFSRGELVRWLAQMER